MSLMHTDEKWIKILRFHINNKNNHKIIICQFIFFFFVSFIYFLLKGVLWKYFVEMHLLNKMTIMP